MRTVVLAASALALGVTAGASAGASAATPVPVSASTSAEGAKLRAIFAASDEAQLKRNPLEALYRGDLRYADRLGDYLTPAYDRASAAAHLADRAALARIDRGKLTPDEQISYDVFKYNTDVAIAGDDPAIVRSSNFRPIDHFTGLQTLMPDLSSGSGAAPFKTVADYDNNLKRLDGYVAFLDRAIAAMRGGAAAGITNPRLVMANAAAQFDAMVGEGVEGSTFYKPVTTFPATIPAADQARLKTAYAAFIRDRLIPAETRMRDFIRDDYLAKARTTVGLSQMPGGAAIYRYLVRTNTTTDMTPDAIHALGLSEVARIHAAMEKVKATVGFKGTLPAFFTFMRTDARFAPASRDAMRDAFLAIDKRVAATVGRDFALTPKSPLEVRPVPAFKEKTDAAGSYQQGTPDGSRPGVFYYNGYDLPSRFTWGFETLFLHEAVPGHHFQISLAQENTALPAFQRFGGNTAYVEGWALYAESLGPELGMFTDPYQLYGHLNDEILRAMRLVVDTGLHAKGWGRDQAIAYMLDNSAMGRSDATAEVERYIAMPGQALAYKIGALTIQRLRRKAQGALGTRFDPRAFHAQVLGSGALPMAVLEAKIDRWIAASKAGT